MTNLPRISIITPSYNQGIYIQHTIESVLNQNYPDLEYWVIDGGSTDQTLDILRSYGQKIQWISEKDHGQSHAINKGFHRSTGQIIAFLNSDDIYEPGALLAVGNFFNAHPDAFWVAGKCHFIDQNGRRIRKLVSMYKNYWLLWKSYTILMIMNYAWQQSSFWRREIIDKIGYIDEDLKYAMDYDYELRIGKEYKLWVLNQYLASFRIHSSSKAGSSANAQFDADLKIMKKYASSPLLVKMHKLHNNITVGIYRRLMRTSG